MAKSKRPPAASRLIREPTTAFARRVRTDSGDGGDEDSVPPAKTAAGSGPTKAPDGTVGAVTTDAPGGAATPPAAPTAPAAAPTTTGPAPATTAPAAREPEPAAPAPAPLPVAPPDAPTTVAPPPAAPKLELLPDPSAIPPGNPDDPADPPGLVPPGDSRSLRRGGDFVLVYRVTNIVVSRFGPIGKRGQFRVVEYPTTAYAANAYARECSRWVSEGFADFRGP